MQKGFQFSFFVFFYNRKKYCWKIEWEERKNIKKDKNIDCS